MAKRQLKERPRNHGTMTESAFWGMIRAVLRKGTVYWKPRLACLAKAKRPYKGSNPRQKYEYVCANCNKGFTAKEVEVNHIEEVGSLRNSTDLASFVEALYCEVDNLECLCKPCHLEKTNQNRKCTEKT